jgi:uncharacterized protein
MQKRKGTYLFAPSDLLAFLGCTHATVLDIDHLDNPATPRAPTESDELIVAKGRDHEVAYLQSLKDAGHTVAEISAELPYDERVRGTVQALYGGVDVIYQAALTDGRWGGYADFLIKTDQPSALGPFSYEASDTKLAKRPEPSFLIQLGIYSSLLANEQQLPPAECHLILGDGHRESFRVQDFAAYIRHAQQRFERFVATPPADSYPQPCQHCAYCRWRDRCDAQWLQDDHLSLVANMQRSQTDKFTRAGITTLAELAEAPPETRVPELNPIVFQRLRAQAALQLHKRTTGQNKYDLIAPEEGRGFARLPQPDAGDLFFDMEGDPLYPDGLEYLFGVCFQRNGQLAFKAFWAHDHVQEKQAFAAFMAFLGDHLVAHPDAFIYHYNHYETTALKRLASRHAVAEHQLDGLLRRRKFVDLYRVVREAIRVSEPSYSLKNLETFYAEKRQGDVATAGDSIVVYNRWRHEPDQKLLDDIGRYNETDCRSTAGLRDWLLMLRPADVPWLASPEPEPSEAATEKDELRRQRERRYADYQTQLVDGAPDQDKHHRQHLADLLGFHDREAKPQWWAFFERQQRLEDELLDDMECLAGLELAKPPEPVKLSLAHTYRYPPQDTKLREGSKVVNVATLNYAGTIEKLDEATNHVTLKIGKKNGPLPQRISIGPEGPIQTNVLREALYRVARSLLDGNDHYPAIRDILAKVPSRLGGRTPGQPLGQNDDALAGIIDAVAALDRSYLFIQGPPGAGKTYFSAHVIVELIRRGKRIGVASNSHKAVHNLLDRIEQVAIKSAVKFQGLKKATGDESTFAGTYIRSETDARKIDIDVELLAGTAWFFADERLDRHLDYLFIDEAGQVSIANAAAMGTSARNIVLVGDQMQLGQPIQGVHPGDSRLSVLDFLLSGQATVPPDRGIFLNKTWRLRPELCRFISDTFYDGRLESVAGNSRRQLDLSRQGAGFRPAGVEFHAVEHSGCSQKSEEEGRVIRRHYQTLLATQVRDLDGTIRPMTPEDILVVSPYNLQVNHLLSVLPAGARVGTVDKFQGQEAPVVLVSMATSSAEYMPRDIDFLFSANRMNVAVSRAQCLAVVVASPELLATPCRTVDQLRLVNNFCRLAEYAAGTSPDCRDFAVQAVSP